MEILANAATTVIASLKLLYPLKCIVYILINFYIFTNGINQLSASEILLFYFLLLTGV